MGAAAGPRLDGFGAQLPDWAPALRGAAADAGEDIQASLVLARDYGGRLPLPGSGRTAERWAVLAAVARTNLTVARVLEAHTDALAILAEAGQSADPGSAWGVFAAEAPEVRLDAVIDADGRAAVCGTKPWCSLGGVLDSAVLTAHLGDERGLFRVDLRQDSVRADPPEGWAARGLRTIPSGPVHFASTPASPVGDPGWYLRRPGFAWGGIGVAACWYGGALGICDTLLRYAGSRDGELNSLHVGAVDLALHASHAVLTEAAVRVDTAATEPALLALRTRSVVADTVERVLHQAGHALGPGPLAFDASHAGRVADLTLYVRQHHGERDLAALGAQVLALRART